jgi:hypothetical protein
MDQLRDSTSGQADASEDDERAKARKAQEVIARTSTDVQRVCLVILTMLAVLLHPVLRRADHPALRAGAGADAGAWSGDAFVEPPAPHSEYGRGTDADRRTVQRDRGAWFCGFRPGLRLDRQGAAIAACPA